MEKFRNSPRARHSAFVAANVFDSNRYRIVNIDDPKYPCDAVTKQYLHKQLKKNDPTNTTLRTLEQTLRAFEHTLRAFKQTLEAFEQTPRGVRQCSKLDPKQREALVRELHETNRSIQSSNLQHRLDKI